jgi:hypothetical protein
VIALSCGIDGCETVHVSTLETVEGALVDAILDAGWSSEPEDEVPVLCGGCTELVADGAVYSCEECGALAYPDDWTLVPYRGKPASDGPRYRAIGNGWAVPVVAWIFRRLDLVEDAR